MHTRGVHESPRRRIARRVGAAGIALAALLALGACKATGGGYVGAPLESGVIGEYTGDANFGFNFTCEVDTAKKRTVIKGEITYHDDPSTVDGLPYSEGIRLHGTVKPIVFLKVTECGTALDMLFEPPLPEDPDFPPPFDGIPAAQFEGTYRPQDSDVLLPPLVTDPNGTFTVLVGDQGEPARPGEPLTGDLFSIELFGGAYGAYTRGGYIEGGNIQVY
jgi:hypothetical protein